MTDRTPARFTLRQLPLPAKLVVTLFMLTVGLGYTSAMVQMHFQHTRRDGQPMPMVADVVEIFAGKKWVTPGEAEAARPVSKLEKLIMGPTEGAPFNASGSMAPAFFQKDPAEGPKNYRALVGGNGRGRAAPDPHLKAKVDAEREGERAALQLWIGLPDDQRRAAYEADRFVPPADKAPKAITAEFAPPEHGGVKVKSILEARCVACHQVGCEAGGFPLENYEQLAAYLATPVATEVPPGGGWCRSDRQISQEKLAQSTHAHLLSFAMLFGLTGLVFAFTGYPTAVRAFVGPLVLVAQVADVACWWLARLPESGPYFAMCIIATGGMVGLGLATQIVLSVFDMYAWKGKAVLAALFLGTGGLGLVGYTQVVKPHLDAQKARKEQQERMEREAKQKGEAAAKGAVKEAAPDAEKGNTPAVAPPAPPKDAVDAVPPKKTEEPMGKNGKTDPPATSPAAPSKLERLLSGEPFQLEKRKGMGWGAKPGGMVRAFFDKDEEVFLVAMDNGDPQLPRLIEEREGERQAVLAWVKAPADVRKKAYEDDRFPLPAAVKVFTPQFKADDQAVKVKSLLTTRCATCHNPEGDQWEKPLTRYEEFEKYLAPEAKTAPAPGNGDKPAEPNAAAVPAPAETPAPAPAPNPIPPAVEPIPAAKD